MHLFYVLSLSADIYVILFHLLHTVITVNTAIIKFNLSCQNCRAEQFLFQYIGGCGGGGGGGGGEREGRGGSLI